VRRSQHLGLALASSLGIIAYTIVLFVLLNRRTKSHEEGSLVVFFLKVSAASCIAGVACYKLAGWLENYIAWQGTIGSLLLLTLVSAAGIIVLLILLKLFRVPETGHYLRRLFKLFWGRKTRQPQGE
jgi:peptidoglycan biosynthesis protein MviN/MurJ (putative lipid II flippase)